MHLRIPCNSIIQISDHTALIIPRALLAGVVRRGVYRGQRVAVKTVRATKVTESAMRKFRDEMVAMAPLRHEHLVNLVGVTDC